MFFLIWAIRGPNTGLRNTIDNSYDEVTRIRFGGYNLSQE